MKLKTTKHWTLFTCELKGCCNFIITLGTQPIKYCNSHLYPNSKSLKQEFRHLAMDNCYKIKERKDVVYATFG